MVLTAAQTEGVIFGEEGIASVDKQGLAIIIMSTLDPSIMRALGEKLEEKRKRFLLGRCSCKWL